MTIKRRRVEATLSTNPTTTQFAKLGLGSKYAKLVAIRARSWASSAKAAAGIDALMKIRITDNNGQVVFLDAADRDYKTAEITLLPAQDDAQPVAGATSPLAVDATGTVFAAATQGPVGIIMESPVQVVIENCATATDFMTVDLIVEGP